MSDLGKKPQCLSCKHNLSNDSCNSCADKGRIMIEDLSGELDINTDERESKEIISLKYNCKIIARYPEDFKDINVFNCKYYLPSAFCFR